MKNKITTLLTTSNPSGYGKLKRAVSGCLYWLRGQDLNLRPSGYEPCRFYVCISGNQGYSPLSGRILKRFKTISDIKVNTKTTTDDGFIIRTIFRFMEWVLSSDRAYKIGMWLIYGVSTFISVLVIIAIWRVI